MDKLKVSGVVITSITPKDGHIGYATVLVNDDLLLTSIAVYRKRKGGYRILFPTSKTGLHYHRPLSQEASRLIESAVVRECELVFDGRKW